jgi:hypothetical protein
VLLTFLTLLFKRLIAIMLAQEAAETPDFIVGSVVASAYLMIPSNSEISH